MDADLADTRSNWSIQLPRRLACTGFQDVTYSYKETVADESWLRRLARKWYYRTINARSEPGSAKCRRLPLADAPRVRSTADAAGTATTDEGPVQLDRLHAEGHSVRTAERVAGKTKFSAVKLAVLAIDGITSFSILPLRLATWVGLVLALVSGGYGVWTIFEKYFFGIAVPGYPTLITTIAFIGAAQLIFLGIIGEYLGKVLIEVKERPVAIVESDERLVDSHMQVQVALPGSGSRVETFSRPVVER